MGFWLRDGAMLMLAGGYLMGDAPCPCPCEDPFECGGCTFQQILQLAISGVTSTGCGDCTGFNGTFNLTRNGYADFDPTWPMWESANFDAGCETGLKWRAYVDPATCEVWVVLNPTGVTNCATTPVGENCVVYLGNATNFGSTCENILMTFVEGNTTQCTWPNGGLAGMNVAIVNVA